MNLKLIASAAIVVLIVVVASASIYIVDENQQVVVTQFGRPVGDAITTPGIHLKTPFVQNVHIFEKRFLEWSGERNQIPTKDKRFIWVDAYARWRITDPLKFYQRVRDERGAKSRLDDIIDGETRNAVANHDLLEVVRSSNRAPLVESEIESEEAGEGLVDIKRGRNEIMAQILKNVSGAVEDLGIEVIDVRFKQINYNEDVRPRVYERMIAERQRIAQKYRSEGQGENARIRGEKERELQVITSEVFKQTEEIRGRADAHATEIYADAYNIDPEFYRFLKTMESYKQVLDSDSTLVLSTESEFFNFLEYAE